MIDSYIVQNSPIGIFVVDKNDSFTVFNRSMESICEVSADDIIGGDLDHVFSEHFPVWENELKELFQEAKSSLETVAEENIPFSDREKELILSSVTFFPVVDDSGSYDGMVCYVGEICEEGFREKGLLDEISSASKEASVEKDIPVVIFRWSAEKGRPVLFVSDNISQIGYTKEELESGAIKYIDIVHPEDRNMLLADFESFETTDRVYFSDDYRLLNRSGDSFWVNEISLLKKKDDSSFRYDGIVIDKTDRKKAELSLKEERDRLERISSGMGLGLAVISRDFRTIWANDILRDIFGDVENKLCYGAYNKRSKVCDGCAVREVFDKGLDRVVREQQGFDRNGNPMWSEIIATPIKDSDGNITAAMQVVIPVTKRKMRELELNENRARIESILRSAPVGIGVIKDGRFEDVNDRCSEILGYSGEELTGRSIRSLFDIDDTYSDVEAVLKSGIKENGVGTIDTQAKRKDGRIIDVEISATPIYPENPSKAISFTVMDVTESKKNERELKKHTQELEQLNRLKDLFSDIIRHDLLNPAGTIKGYTEILEEMEDDENKLHILKMIQDSNKRLIELIENASKYEKLNSIDEIDYFDEDLVAVFEEVVRDFGQALADKNIDVNLFSEGPCVYAVNPLVSEVFANLLSNAIKYGPEGERIDIAFHDNDNTCKVTISDQGDGILDEDKLFVFDRFKRLDKKGVKGTGLGLAIVKRIMELHGGSYGVEDNPEGKGSVFWVTFSKSCL